jgi:hypothetical protein
MNPSTAECWTLCDANDRRQHGTNVTFMDHIAGRIKR